ncbi:hypothetical protein [Streptosporangium sp. CA-115845]
MLAAGDDPQAQLMGRQVEAGLLGQLPRGMASRRGLVERLVILGRL